MKSTIEINESNFYHEVLRSPHPVVVDFWAGWCGPCRMLSPVLDEVAHEQHGRAVVAKVNVDENPVLAARFQIQSIPTLLYFHGGKLRDRSMGVVGKHTIISKLTGLRSAQSEAKAA